MTPGLVAIAAYLALQLGIGVWIARRIRNESEFVSWVMGKIGASPDAYRKIKAVNLGLLQVWEMEAQELETGKNACALG